MGNEVKIAWWVKKIPWWFDAPIWKLIAKLDDMTPNIEIRWTVKDVMKKIWQKVVDIDEKLKFVDLKFLVKQIQEWDYLWAVNTLNNTTTKYWSATAPLAA